MTNINSPYRGLTPYTEADAAYFFGRAQESANLAANLEVARLTIFYGPSGVGKSSVLRAGVMYMLQQRAQENMTAGGRPEIIPVYFNRWQSEPLQGLTHAIFTEVRPFLKETVEVRYTNYESQFAATLAALSEQTDSELLIILDQFEEYFLYHPDEQGPDSFARQFVQAVNRADLRANFMLSVREDALGRLDRFKGQIPFLLDNRLSIEHLNRAAGYEAVTRPLEQYNLDHNTHYTIEPALVETILDQVGRGKVALSKQGANVSEVERRRVEAPYLQLVLDRLWQEVQIEGFNVWKDQEPSTDSPLITIRATTLARLGGVENIVNNYVNESINELWLWEQELAARLFDRLVTLGGRKIALTQDELIQYANADSGRVQALLQKLDRKRLLRSIQSPNGITQYEIFHDVLGQALLAWQTRYQEAQTEVARLAEEQKVRAEVEQHTREAQTQATIERHNNARLRWLLALLASLLVLALFTSWWAYQEQQRANYARATAQVSLSIVATRESEIIAARATTESALQALTKRTQSTILFASGIPTGDTHQGSIYSIKFSPDGKAFASAGTDGTVRIWDLAHLNSEKFLKHSLAVDAIAFSSDGNFIVSAGWDTNIVLWDVKNGLKISSLIGHTDWVTTVDISSNIKQIASGSLDRTIRIWDVGSGKELVRFSGHTGAISEIAFSPDGKTLASGSADSTVRIWDTISGKLLFVGKHDGEVNSVIFSPDGKFLISGGSDGRILVWDVSTGKLMRSLKIFAAVKSLAISHDGMTLANGGSDGTIMIWNIVTGKQIYTLTGSHSSVNSVTFRVDGKLIASGSDDGFIRAWNLVTGEESSILF
ncbi:MAG: WD40 repeat domain-containing protein [Caldilineaceae bacterium]